MSKLIDRNKPLDLTYGSLCIRFREIKVAQTEGSLTCTHCRCLKKEHVPQDSRCTVSCLSAVFHADEEDELVKIERALSLLEELQTI